MGGGGTSVGVFPWDLFPRGFISNLNLSGFFRLGFFSETDFVQFLHRYDSDVLMCPRINSHGQTAKNKNRFSTIQIKFC